MISKVTKAISSLIPSNKIDVFGHDSLMASSLPYYMLAFVEILAFWIHYKTQNPFIILFIMYSLIPLLDEFFSIDAKNPNKQESKELLQEGFKYQFPIFLTVIIDWAIFFYALNYYQNIELTWSTLPLLLGFIAVIFGVNSAQFAVAHEIMHKPGIRRIIGTWHMLKTLNIHFTTEHVFGHHRRVATPEDPASAAKGINVYSFFIRSYFGAYGSAYQIEKDDGKKFWNNYAVLSIVSSILFCVFIFAVFGLQAFICFLLQAFGAVFYLQVINYIEHYGLRRRKVGVEKDGNNRYEKVTVRHSWNSAHRFSNYLFFKLQRHSDHHQNAMKPYQTLLTIDEAAQLPHGYIIMTVMALFPSTFYRIMDPLVDNYAKYNENNEEMKGVYATAVRQTRDFIIKISLTTTILFCLSKFIV